MISGGTTIDPVHMTSTAGVELLADDPPVGAVVGAAVFGGDHLQGLRALVVGDEAALHAR